jgi:ribose 5-phosphate isomerase B
MGKKNKKILTVAIGADHRGYVLKKYIIDHLPSLNTRAIFWCDVGTSSRKRTDYPIFARKVAQLVSEKKTDCGLLLCGTGVGMVIAANRYAKVRAALAWNATIAQLSKEEDNANILVIPADYVEPHEAITMTTVWLMTQFKKGRYTKRLAMIDRER